MTKAMIEIDNQMIVVTVLASFDEHIRICTLHGQVLLCRGSHLTPCFQPEARFSISRDIWQNGIKTFECNS